MRGGVGEDFSVGVYYFVYSEEAEGIVSTEREGGGILIFVSLPRRCLNAGSRTGDRDTFFCLAKRKYPKKRPPRCRLFPALLGFERGCLKGLPSPCMQRAASMRRP